MTVNITEVSVNYGVTLSRQFQGARVDVGFKATLEEGQSAEEIKDLLLAKCKEYVGLAIAQWSPPC